VVKRAFVAEAKRQPAAEINTGGEAESQPYRLHEQVGFLLRQATQRHTAIFAARMIEDLTPTQWAALARLNERGPCSQNLLGRFTAMDAATIKGVVDRLVSRGLAEARSDPQDSRRLTIVLTEAGRDLVGHAIPAAREITEATLARLSASERRQILKLLGKLK
jgi:MarR family transcriptional regulator, lower aerobic nicotinate degradation pathway regulator